MILSLLSLILMTNTGVQKIQAPFYKQVAAASVLHGPAKVTSYCGGCDSSGVTRSGKKLSSAYCAADPKYWKPGTKIYFPALGKTYIIEDTGGAVKGKHRFDVCQGPSRKCVCSKFGVKKLKYQVIYLSKRSW